MKSVTRSLLSSAMVTLLSVQPAALAGQAFGPLSPGDEVRVSYRTTTASMLNTGHDMVRLEFVRMDESQLVGRSHGRLVLIDTRAIRSVRRRIGTKPASAPAMVLGSGAGFAVGFVFGALSASADSRGRTSAADAGLYSGVLFGAPLGAFLAWAASRSHGIYESVPIRRVRPVATVSPSGRVGLTFKVGTP